MSKNKGKTKKRKQSQPESNEDEAACVRARVNEEVEQRDEERFEEIAECQVESNLVKMMDGIPSFPREKWIFDKHICDKLPDSIYQEIVGLDQQEAAENENVSRHDSTDTLVRENDSTEKALDDLDNLEVFRRDHSLLPLDHDVREAASVFALPPQPEQAYLELFRRLEAEERLGDARALAYFIRRHAGWLEREFGVDLWEKLQSANRTAFVPKQNSMLDKDKDKERNPKRGPYKCRICHKRKQYHLCRPTFAQVAAEVKRTLGKPKATGDSLRRSNSLPTERGNYKCGHCGNETKRDHDCSVVKVYEHTANETRKRLQAQGGDEDEVIKTVIEESKVFAFTERGGRRIWISSFKESVLDAKEGFCKDNAPDSAGLEKLPSDDASDQNAPSEAGVSYGRGPQGGWSHDVSPSYFLPDLRFSSQRNYHQEGLRAVVANNAGPEGNSPREPSRHEDAESGQEEKFDDDQWQL